MGLLQSKPSMLEPEIFEDGDEDQSLPTISDLQVDVGDSGDGVAAGQEQAHSSDTDRRPPEHFKQATPSVGPPGPMLLRILKDGGSVPVAKVTPPPKWLNPKVDLRTLPSSTPISGFTQASQDDTLTQETEEDSLWDDESESSGLNSSSSYKPSSDSSAEIGAIDSPVPTLRIRSAPTTPRISFNRSEMNCTQ